MNILSTTHSFQSLSLKDLLEARKHYHLHLLNKRNVVGTAVSLSECVFTYEFLK